MKCTPSSIYFLFYALMEGATNVNGHRFHALGHSLRRLNLGSNAVQKRAQAATSYGIEGVSNTQDVIYTATVNVGGVPVSLQIDTGSSDLWTNVTVPNSQDLRIPANVTYGLGSIAGSIRVADVEFADYVVPQQAYIGATRTLDMHLEGIIGLGPPQGSVVLAETYQAFNDTRGDPFLNRVFAQNVSTPNFISFLLGRSETPDEPFDSQFTVGEIIDGLEAVNSYPQLPVQIVNPREVQGQHWSIQVDAVIGPDGQQIKVSSGVPNAKKLVAVLDTGFSFPPVPPAVSDAFYGRVQGAQFSPDDGLWIVPCDQELNVAFVIGGVVYNIHPLDAVQVAGTYTDGTPLCVGSFQPNPLNFGSELFDMILGDSFLRNTYTYINFGNFEDENVRSTLPPYVQLLNITNRAQAHQEFVKARLNGIDSTGNSRYSLLPPSRGQTSKGDTQNNLASYTSVHSVHRVSRGGLSKTVKIILAVVAVVVLIGVAICLFCIFKCCSRSMNRRRVKNFGLKGMEAKQPYQPLTVPAPQAHPTFHEPGSYGYYGSGVSAPPTQ